MTGHDWWHDAGLRTAVAVGEGWRLFQDLYLQTGYDAELLAATRRARLAQALTRAARTQHFAPLLPHGETSEREADSVLAALPVLEKDVLRNAPDTLATGLVAPWDELRVHTSGTTGEPVWIAHDNSKLTEATAANLRMLEAYGLRPGMRIIRATADLRHGLVDYEPMPYFGGAMALRINVSTASAHDGAFLSRLCAEFRPDILWGQPLEILLAALRQNDGTLTLPSFRAVLTHGDSMDPQAREAIAGAFDCPHHDLYGLQEFGRVGWECPVSRGTYHIDEERVAVSREEDGQVLLSSLTNTAMSLLRYRPGDAVELSSGPCPCGRPHLRIAGIEGRRRALIVEADGRLVNIKPARLILEEAPLHRWQVRQPEAGRLEVLIVPRVAEDGEELAGRLRAALGEAMSLSALTVRPVELAELATPSGKAPHFRLRATQEALSNALGGGSSSW
ncbi:hypothetical protein ABZ705_08900 [Streptomyces sp. NPDC006984]|uniref:phenylacetate--CoA ligase family protein n=1 Tax=Streptomyces sp. NPDC006984 TaxID=3155463 RepID=UPI0033FE671F